MKSPDFLEKMNRGPVLMLNVQRNGMTSMGRPLALWFVYTLVVAFTSGAVARAALRDHLDGPDIFHAVAVSAFMGYAFALWQGTIWYRRPALTTLKSTIDGALYAVVTGMVFVWLWG